MKKQSSKKSKSPNSKEKKIVEKKNPSKVIKIFTDPLFFLTISSLVILSVIAIVYSDIQKNLLLKDKSEQQMQEITTQIKYWEKISEKYPNTRDAYFNLALLYYRINEYEKSKLYLQKSLTIDPNFENGKKLEVILEGK